jgi:hypothetical protein
MKRASLALGVLALAAFLWPGLTMQKNLAVAATPTPVALQYDQIVRMVIPPATPPAPGAFPADYAAITGVPAGAAPPDASAATATPAPQKHGGIGGLLSTVMGGQPPSGGSQDANDSGMPAGAMDAVNAMRKGALTRYTYYKGWLRTDDVVHQTAVISKCQEHQYITLDLAKKTYTMTNTKPACNTSPQMPMGPHHTQVENEAPGTVDMTVTNSVQNLGPLTIQAIATSGYDNTLQMSMTNAKGSCQNNSMGMNMEQYISKIPLPHQYCPLPQGAGSYDPSSVVVHGGCKPTMHTSGSGAAMLEMDKLVMFSKMSFNAAGGDSHMGGFAQVTERGNVKWYSGATADALFTVPPGFTKAN